MRMIDREKLLAAMDAEIDFAKGTGMPVFVMGLNQARKVIAEMPEASIQEMVDSVEKIRPEPENNLTEWRQGPPCCGAMDVQTFGPNEILAMPERVCTSCGRLWIKVGSVERIGPADPW